MNCRVSDDHTESYLSATRSQPSCSNRVKAFSPLIMPADHRVHDYFIPAEIRAVLLLWRDERCVRPIVFKFWDAMARGSPIVGRFCETPNHEWRLTRPTIYSSGNSIGSSSSRGTSLFRSMIRAQVFQRSNASSWPGGRIASAFSNQLIASRKSSYA
jgi:hypothetical protein